MFDEYMLISFLRSGMNVTNPFCVPSMPQLSLDLTQLETHTR